jgi:hypothetical protein
VRHAAGLGDDRMLRIRCLSRMAHRLLPQLDATWDVGMDRVRASEVVFMVEPDSSAAQRWHIKQSGSVRATYPTRAQAVVDARQLAAFENELRGRIAIVRVLDEAHRVVEDLVCACGLRGPKSPDRAAHPRAKPAR